MICYICICPACKKTHVLGRKWAHVLLLWGSREQRGWRRNETADQGGRGVSKGVTESGVHYAYDAEDCSVDLETDPLTTWEHYINIPIEEWRMIVDAIAKAEGQTREVEG